MRTQIVFCDDIREEKSNKHILIGVYGGEMNVAAGPTSIPISIWIQLLDLPGGRHKFKVFPRKIIGKQRSDLGLAEGEFEGPQGGSFAVLLPGLPIHIDSDCKMSVSMSLDGGKEMDVGSLEIKAIFANQ